MERIHDTTQQRSRRSSHIVQRVPRCTVNLSQGSKVEGVKGRGDGSLCEGFVSPSFGIYIGNAANQNLQLSNKLVNDPSDDGEDEEKRKN